MTKARLVTLPVTSTVPTQLVLGWGLGLSVVGRKQKRRRRTPGPIAVPARKAA